MEKNTAKKESSVSMVLKSPIFGILIPLVVIILVTSLVNENFLKFKNFLTILKIIPFVAIVALGESFTLITGNVDISVGQVSGFMGMLFPFFMIVQGMNPWLSLILTLIAGLLVGAFNGTLIVKLGLPDFVATIGSLYIFQGAKILLTKGYPLSPLPYKLGEMGDATPLLVSWPFWIAVVLFAIVGIVQKKTIWGRRLYATGDNREVAKLSGINVDKMRITAYAICGLMAAIGGILLTIDLDNAVPQNGDGWEFRAIAACAVGGVSLTGGKGTALGTFIGVIIIYILDNAVIMLSVPSAYQKCVIGAVLAASVMFDIIKNKRKIRA